MEEGRLIFTIQNDTLKVISINLDELRVPISFKEYFNQYISKDILFILDENYNENTILNFILNEREFGTITFNGNNNEYVYKFTLYSRNESKTTITIDRYYSAKNVEVTYDFLTGVYSRNYLVSEIQKHLDKGYNFNSYIIIIDLDNYKQINDTFGHLVGDLCLKKIISDVKLVFKNHLVGRYGGDEFLIYVKDVTFDELHALIEEALKIEFKYTKGIKSSDAVTISIGISKEIGNRDNLDELVEEADEALYKCKRLGKNLGSFYKGKIYVGPKNNKALRKKTRISSSYTFKEEIRRKKVLFYTLFISLSAFFVALSLTINIVYNLNISSQADSIASSLMHQQSSDVADKTKKEIEYVYARLYGATKFIDNVEASTLEEFYSSAITKTEEFVDINHAGIILNNGNAYYKYKDELRLYNLTNKAINTIENLNNKIACAERVQFADQDVIMISTPYDKEVSFGSNRASILGIFSYYNIEEARQNIFDSLRVDTTKYLSIITSDGSKILDTQVTNDLSIFQDLTNVLNVYKNDKNQYEKLVNYIDNDSSNVELFDINRRKYYFFIKDIEKVENWKILYVVSYSDILFYIGNLVRLSEVSMLTVSVTTIVLVLFVLSLYYRIKMKSFIAKFVDPLTGIINEHRFVIDAKEAIKKRPGDWYIIYINIAHFKFINNQIGSNKTDALIKDIALYLSKNIKENEMVSREFNDRFMLLLKCETLGICKERISKLLDVLTDEIPSKYDVKLIMSAGIYNFENQDETTYLAIDKARIAAESVYIGRKPYYLCVFDTEMEQKSEMDNYIEQAKEFALQNNKFKVYYQGIYDPKIKEFIGCEALVRWKDDKYGFINTQYFIDLFENDGFILKLDLFVFETVLKDLSERINRNEKVIPISVNLSRRHFHIDNFLDEYEELMNKYNVDGKYLDFEITESVILNERINLENIITKIHSFGSTVSIDDFGSGFSNLNMINKVDFDYLKLDKKLFVGKSYFDDNSKRILEMVCKLIKSLGKKTICEGVESKKQATFLKSIGCDYIQGYYYSKPCEKEEFPKQFEENKK